MKKTDFQHSNPLVAGKRSPLIDMVRDGVSGGVDYGAQGGGSEDRSGVSVGAVDEWGVVAGEDTSAGTGLNKSVLVQMSNASGDDFGGVGGSHRDGGGADWESVRSDAVAQTVSYVIGGDDLTVGGDVTVRADFVTGGVLDGVVDLKGLRVSVRGLAELVLGVVLGLLHDGGGYDGSGDGMSHRGGYGVGGDGVGHRGGHAMGDSVGYRGGHGVVGDGVSYRGGHGVSHGSGDRGVGYGGSDSVVRVGYGGGDGVVGHGVGRVGYGSGDVSGYQVGAVGHGGDAASVGDGQDAREGNLEISIREKYICGVCFGTYQEFHVDCVSVDLYKSTG
jgi:hypothetical protein